jgi:uncharacterized protein involved in exopolysaccharide biosynthesis
MDEDREPGVLDALWRFRWSSAAIVLFVVAVSVSVGLLAQPKAQAKATILLATPPENSVLTPDIQGDASLARYTAQRAGFVTSDQMLAAVAKNLVAPRSTKAPTAPNGAPATTVPAATPAETRSVTDIRGDLTASPSSTSNAIVITARADSAAEAVRLADATVAAYRSETAKEVTDLTNAAVKSIEASETRVQRDAALNSGGSNNAAANTLSELAIQASDLRTSQALFGDGVEFVVAASTDAVTRPSLPIREGALGFVLGLVIAATVAWIRSDDEYEDELEYGHVASSAPPRAPSPTAASQ